MARVVKELAGRTFHLRKPRGLEPWMPVHVRVTEDDGRISVHGGLPYGTSEDDLRRENPGIGTLFEIFAMGRVLSCGSHVADLIRGGKPVVDIQIDASVLASARALYAEAVGRAESLASKSVRAASAARGRPGIAKGRRDTLSGRLRKAVEDLALEVAVVDVVQSWARDRLLGMIEILLPGEDYVSVGPRRDEWSVGCDVLSVLRAGGLSVSVDAATRGEHVDEFRLTLSAGCLSLPSEVRTRKRHPDPAVEWAWRVHQRQSRPLPALEEEKSEILAVWRRWEVKEPDLPAKARVAAQAQIDRIRDERQALVSLVGEDCLARAVSMPGKEAGDDA